MTSPGGDRLGLSGEGQLSEAILGQLEESWQRARQLGFIGPAAVKDLALHASGYLRGSLALPPKANCVDLGSGVGIPGLLLALLRPETDWILLDASRRRCDLAQTAIEDVSKHFAGDGIGLVERVQVVHARAEEFAHDLVWPGQRFAHDLVVARSFGSPSEVAECGLPLLRPNGSLIVSVSEKTSEVWRNAEIEPLCATFIEEWTTNAGSYVRIQRTKETIDKRFPRRKPARLRSPLF